MLRFKFNELKATQVAALFLKKNNGKMNYMKLIKLLYLVDREALSQWERPITGDTYFSMRHGPILSNVLDKINTGKEPHIKSYWHEHISILGSYSVRLKEDPGVEELSKREKGLITEIDRRYKTLDQWQMRDICHKILPEWKDPGDTSFMIDVKDILEAIGKTPREIEIATEEVQNLNFVTTVLSAE